MTATGRPANADIDIVRAYVGRAASQAHGVGHELCVECEAVIDALNRIEEGLAERDDLRGKLDIAVQRYAALKEEGL